jgi:hypothetical protein
MHQRGTSISPSRRASIFILGGVRGKPRHMWR